MPNAFKMARHFRADFIDRFLTLTPLLIFVRAITVVRLRFNVSSYFWLQETWIESLDREIHGLKLLSPPGYGVKTLRAQEGASIYA